MTEIAVPRAASASQGWLRPVVTSGWLWGGLLTVAFYAVLPHLPVNQADAHRYFCAHWIEYCTTGLFFVAMATLGVKFLGVPRERQVLSAGLLEDFDRSAAGSDVPQAERLANHLRLVAREHRNSQLVRRMIDVCDYVRARRSADGLEGQLNHLGELAWGRLTDSYALVRTVTWAVPILGFLGTVIGITMSIANLTPDQLESSLGEVTAGLAVAFDTTALSLTLSMGLVFATFVVERQEQRILEAVEDFSSQKLLALFPTDTKSAGAGPLMDAERAAAEQLLAKTESLVNWQMEAWKSSLESLRDRWTTTLEQHQRSLDEALQSGLRESLADHTQQLSATRQEFMTAFQSAGAALRDAFAQSQLALQQQQAGHQAQLQETWTRIHAETAQCMDLQTENVRSLQTAVSSDVRKWNEQLQVTSGAVTQQLQELQNQGAILLKIVEQEELLVRLEERLTQNLETVRVVDSLDATILNLNAAVNLLSTKTRAKAA